MNTTELKALAEKAPAPAQQEASGYGPKLMPQVSGYGPQVETTVAHVAHQCPAFCTYPACQSTGKTCLGACAKQAAQHQEPPQQERKPMTGEEVIEGLSEIGVTVWGPRSEDFERGVRFAERHHGIKE